MVETDDAVEITAKVPRVKESALDLTIADEIPFLKGKKRAEYEVKEGNHQQIERCHGSYHCQIPRGFGPENGAVVVKFVDGTLTLRVAKPAPAYAEAHKFRKSTVPNAEPDLENRMVRSAVLLPITRKELHHDA